MSVISGSTNTVVDTKILIKRSFSCTDLKLGRTTDTL